MGTKSILAISLIAVLVIGAVSFDDAFAKDPKEPKPTKLQKECAKEPKKDNKIKPDCELLELINDVDVDPRASDFFDVFFDVELYTVDSFFDIFTQLQTAFADTSSDIQQILGLLTSPTFGLEEIKTEVAIIETKVLDPDTGLVAIKTAVDNIDTSGSGGIPASTQTQIDTIETETGKIQMIKDDVGAIKTDIQGIKNKVIKRFTDSDTGHFSIEMTCFAPFEVKAVYVHLEDTNNDADVIWEDAFLFLFDSFNTGVLVGHNDYDPISGHGNSAEFGSLQEAELLSMMDIGQTMVSGPDGTRIAFGISGNCEGGTDCSSVVTNAEVIIETNEDNNSCFLDVSSRF